VHRSRLFVVRCQNLVILFNELLLLSSFCFADIVMIDNRMAITSFLLIFAVCGIVIGQKTMVR
jgi:hypothetical protein